MTTQTGLDRHVRLVIEFRARENSLLRLNRRNTPAGYHVTQSALVFCSRQRPEVFVSESAQTFDMAFGALIFKIDRLEIPTVGLVVVT